MRPARTAPCALLFCAAPALAQGVPQLTVFGIDYKSRTVGFADSFGATPITEADLLLPQALLPQLGPLLVPGIAESGGAWPQGGLSLALHAAAVGHAPNVAGLVEVDAISHGLDRRIERAWGWPGAPASRFAFSVDRDSYGIAGLPGAPNLVSEAQCGQQAADVYRDLGFALLPAGPGSAMAGNTLVVDGNGMANGNSLSNCLGAAFPGLGLGEAKLFNEPGSKDDLDALDRDVPDQWLPRATRTYFSLDSAFVNPYGMQPNTGSAAIHGWRGGDILYAEPSGFIGIYAISTDLGLDTLGADTDDVDALAICENGSGGFQRNNAPFDWLTGASDMVLFSVRRGSKVIGNTDCLQGLPIEPGDILIPPLPGYAVPGILVAAEALGLHTLRSGALINVDDLDALDTLHDEPTVQEHCSADGGAVPCPCGNNGAPGRGCGNSFNPLGAKCWANGTASISADTLLISGSGMPFSATTTLVQGTIATAPTPFGDGLRCVSGAQRRLYTRNCYAGNVQFGHTVPGLASISSMGGLVVPGTRHYQMFYRNTVPYCTTSTTNTTNALSVSWTP
ncbi:MAG: hypothetical protein RL112_912 [Planctomycetota bacterium]